MKIEIKEINIAGIVSNVNDFPTSGLYKCTSNGDTQTDLIYVNKTNYMFVSLDSMPSVDKTMFEELKKEDTSSSGMVSENLFLKALALNNGEKFKEL